jgi:hypothetical protein
LQVVLTPRSRQSLQALRYLPLAIKSSSDFALPQAQQIGFSLLGIFGRSWGAGGPILPSRLGLHQLQQQPWQIRCKRRVCLAWELAICNVVVFSVVAQYSVSVVVQHAFKPSSACNGLLGGCESYFGVGCLQILGPPLWPISVELLLANESVQIPVPKVPLLG